jgi:hypothetical protein
MAYFFGLEILGVFGICIVFSFLILCVYKLWNRLEKFKTGFTGAIAHLNEATSGSVPINEEEQILLRAVIDRDFDGKIVVSESLPDKVAKYIRTYIKEQWYFKLGMASTGIALVFTFLLLGQAVHEIGNSLGEEIGSPSKVVSGSQAPNGSSTDKSSIDKAFKNMKGKFIVSVAGLLSTICFSLFASILIERSISEIKRRMHVLDGKLSLFVDEDFQIQRRSLQELKKLSHLENLQVNVNELSEGLLGRLNDTLDRTIGQKLVDLAAKQESGIERIALALSESVSNSLEKAMNNTMSNLNDSMRNIAEKMDERSSGGVELILEKLQDLLSGGTKNHTAEMGKAIGQFNDTVGDLNRAMGAIISAVGDLSEGAKNQNKQQMRFAQEDMPAIMQRFADTVASIEKQNQLTMSSMERVLGDGQQRWAQSFAASEEKLSHSSTRMADSLEAQVTKVGSHMEKVLKTTDAVYESQIKLLTHVDSVVRELGRVGAEMTIVQSDITMSLSSVKDISHRMGEVSAGLERMPIVVHETSSKIEANIGSQNQLLEHQRLIWTKMTDDYTQRYAEMAKTLKGQFEDLHRAFQKGTEIHSGLSGLSESIDELSEIMSKRNLT